MTKLTKEQKELCKITTIVGRLSYPHLFKAQKINQKSTTEKAKYSATLLVPKDKDLTGTGPYPDFAPRTFKGVIRNAKINRYGEDKTKWPKFTESPISDGDDPKYEGKDGYKGCWVIKFSTNEDKPPVVVSNEKDDEGRYLPVTDPNEIYPGCYVRISGYANAWEYMNKYGVSLYLDHVQKVKDGKSFGSKKSAEQVFSPLAAETDDADEDSDDNDEGFL